MRSFAERLDEFVRLTVPADAGATQRQAMRMAFAAGFAEGLAAFIDAGHEAPDMEAGSAMIAKMESECLQTLTAGGA